MDKMAKTVSRKRIPDKIAKTAPGKTTNSHPGYKAKVGTQVTLFCPMNCFSLSSVVSHHTKT